MAQAAECAGHIRRKYFLFFKLHYTNSEAKDLFFKENLNTSLKFANCVHFSTG